MKPQKHPYADTSTAACLSSAAEPRSDGQGRVTNGIADFLQSLWARGRFPAILLATATIMAYLPVWQAGFIWDDDTFLVDNQLIHKPDGLYRFWFTTEAPDYFPMASTTLWLEWRLWGQNPLGYHIVNVLLHAVSAVFLWRVLSGLRIPGAWLAAAIFALHPVNVESVAWITERKNTLTMLFYVLTLWSYLRFEDTGQRRWYWIAVAGFAFALLSKTAVVMLPFVLLAIVWWRHGRVAPRDLWRSLTFLGTAALLGAVTVWFQYHRAIGAAIVREDSFWSRLAAAGWAVWFYLYKAVLPLNLSFVYPRWHIDAGSLVAYLPGLLMAGAVLACWCYRRQWGKAWFLGLGYFAIMLLPVLGFLNIYFMRYSLVADHWQYFAIIGPLALVAAGIATTFRLLSQEQRLLEPLFCGVLLLVLGALTWHRIGAFRNVETLWRDTLVRNPGCWLAHNNLGQVLFRTGRVDEALTHFRQALEIEPTNPMAYYNLGNTLLQMGQVDQAIAHYRKALEIQPDSPQFHNNLGNALLQQGQLSEAIAHFRKALEIQPKNPETANNLAWLFATCSDAAFRNGAEAVELARQAIRFSDGPNPALFGTLAAAYAEAGDFDQAVACGEQARALARAAGNTALAERNARLLEFYRARRPYREPFHPRTAD